MNLSLPDLWLARIIRGQPPFAYRVTALEPVVTREGKAVAMMVRGLGAWRIRNGRGAWSISSTRASAIASAKVLMEEHR